MVGVPSDRYRLRATFDSAAHLYQQARPGYPAELYDELIGLAGLRPPARLLEIGCATGKATVPLAERGFRITCLELGPRLAATARDNLARFPAVTVTEADFDTWLAPPDGAFDLVFAATAWHWTDPATRYQRAWTLLAPGGHLAFWEASHVFAVDGDPIFDDIQRLYQEIGEGLPPGAVQPRPGELPDSRAEIEASGLFADVTVRQFDWAVSYTAAEYLSLLSTFSGHIEMAPGQRDHLYQGIQRLLAARPGGRLRRHWGAALHIARRADR